MWPVWGYRPVYPHGSTWATPDKVAQLVRKARTDLRTARRAVRGKQRLLDSRGNLVRYDRCRILCGYMSCNWLGLDSSDL
jgi:hypothetical protein